MRDPADQLIEARNPPVVPYAVARGDRKIVLTRHSVLHKRLRLIVDGHGQYSTRSQRLAGKDFLHYRLNAGNGTTGTGTGLTSRR
jgi:hypothetical protein